MGKSLPISLPNGKSWPKKSDAAAHFKAMLHRYKVGDRVNDPSDHADLAALVQIYDSVLTLGDQTKAGSSIAYFEKRPDADHPGNTACFFVVRTDGTSIDFSIYRALDVASSLTT